jgi:hypothetical protein
MHTLVEMQRCGSLRYSKRDLLILTQMVRHSPFGLRIGSSRRVPRDA